MPREITLADIDRAHALFSNHLAMGILAELGRSHGPTEVSRNANPRAIVDALRLLGEMDLVRIEPGAGSTPNPNQPVALTPRGASFVHALGDISGEAD